jgi:hypothetical protein
LKTNSTQKEQPITLLNNETNDKISYPEKFRELEKKERVTIRKKSKIHLLFVGVISADHFRN